MKLINNIKRGMWFVLLITFTHCFGVQDTSNKQPNIIYILTDDQRIDTLGFTGNEIIKTPNIDQLAKDGVFFSNASVTSAICMPSRVSYFLGQYERRHGVNFNSGTAVSSKAWQNSFPVLLKQAGYFTGYVGKNHCPVGKKGYQTGVMEKAFDYWYAAHGHIGFYLKENYPAAAKVFKNAHANTQIEIIEEGVMDFLGGNENLMNNADTFLEKRPDDKPFCLSICFNIPHDCSTEKMKQLPEDPEIYRSLYRDKEITLSENYVAKKDISNPKIPAEILHTQHRQGTYHYVDTQEKAKERILRTYQAVTGIDKLIGHLREKLKELGLDQNTIIIYSSDHGIMQGEFGLGGKALNYEKCLNVPLIIYNPLKNAPLRNLTRDELVQSIDIAPTILQMAGVEIPQTVQGQSLIPLLQTHDITKWRDYAFAENLWSNEHGNPRVESVRDQRWKYIRYFEHNEKSYTRTPEALSKFKKSGQLAQKYRHSLSASINGEMPVYEELFDLKTDPEEVHNLANSENHISTLKKLRKVCKEQVKLARGDSDNPDSVEYLKF